MDIAPAANPAAPAMNTASAEGLATATPTMSAEIETILREEWDGTGRGDDNDNGKGGGR